jgi:O-methyltransferase involved in polyketide biosynthesis
VIVKQAKIPNNIQDNIADTLYIPLLMKCNETRRKAPFFSDPFACDIVNKVDYDFSKYENAVRSSVGVAIRAKYFDQLTEDFIQKHKNPIVVNVGCGLDTRYERLGPEITGSAVFYELDIPEAMELRERFLHASENDIYLKGSIFEIDWMDQLKNKHPRAAFLFIAEGVFMYFGKEQVKGVFVNLSERFPNSNILFDVTSSWMCKNSHRHDTVKHTSAPFQLALDDDKEIETWAKNLKLESVRHYGDFRAWKRCGFMTYWVMRMIPKIKNASRLMSYTIG